VLQTLGVQAVIARSFARIFFRNAINIGFPAVGANTDDIAAGDRLRLDLGEWTIENVTRGVTISCRSYPSVMLAMPKDGGLVRHLKKHETYQLS
jgi:3-isopropylmalate/(R)-2-methylmalate dehydratase small subunit